jgi:pSer/pThr/pTyr-binding forkhead associated (FHA) protein
MSVGSSSLAGPYVTLHLLDSTKGHTVQTWSFRESAVIKIGRLEDNDVVLTDPVVSRLHMILKQQDGNWVFEAVGKHGVIVNDCRHEAGTLENGAVFRLGASGPTMTFYHRGETSTQPQTHTSTVEFGSVIDDLGFDRLSAAEQVRKITDEQGFQRLLEQAAELRKRRAASQD